MTAKEILAKLKSLSNETVRKHNLKFGADDNQFGVKLGDIRAIAKPIKTNHGLAKELWDTGIIDARLLATLIIDVKALTTKELDALVKSAKFSQLADWVNAYVVKLHPQHEQLRQEWMQSTDPMAARAGWSLTSGRVARNPEGLDVPGLLDRIESQMLQSPPEVQWTMNTTLAQIGIHFPNLRQRAIDIGEKLGVYRDFPVSKGCTSPFAPIWINEIVRRQGEQSS